MYCTRKCVSINESSGSVQQLHPAIAVYLVHDELSMPTSAVNPVTDQTGIEGQENMDSEVKTYSTLAMLLACQRKWLDAETV